MLFGWCRRDKEGKTFDSWQEYPLRCLNVMTALEADPIPDLAAVMSSKFVQNVSSRYSCSLGP